jgi:Flp pilus assembly protein TadD
MTPTSDLLHLLAAQGWTALGDVQQAKANLARVKHDVANEPSVHEIQCQIAAKEGTHDWQIHFALARFCLQIGRMEEAREWIRKAVAVEPQAAREAMKDPDLKPLFEG